MPGPHSSKRRERELTLRREFNSASQPLLVRASRTAARGGVRALTGSPRRHAGATKATAARLTCVLRLRRRRAALTQRARQDAAYPGYGSTDKRLYNTGRNGARCCALLCVPALTSLARKA